MRLRPDSPALRGLRAGAQLGGGRHRPPEPFAALPHPPGRQRSRAPPASAANALLRKESIMAACMWCSQGLFARRVPGRTKRRLADAALAQEREKWYLKALDPGGRAGEARRRTRAPPGCGNRDRSREGVGTPLARISDEDPQRSPGPDRSGGRSPWCWPGGFSPVKEKGKTSLFRSRGPKAALRDDSTAARRPSGARMAKKSLAFRAPGTSFTPLSPVMLDREQYILNCSLDQLLVS